MWSPPLSKKLQHQPVAKMSILRVDPKLKKPFTGYDLDRVELQLRKSGASVILVKEYKSTGVISGCESTPKCKVITLSEH